MRVAAVQLNANNAVHWQKWTRKVNDASWTGPDTGGELAFDNYIGQGQQRKFLESLIQLVKRFKLLIAIEPEEQLD